MGSSILDIKFFGSVIRICTICDGPEKVACGGVTESFFVGLSVETSGWSNDCSSDWVSRLKYFIIVFFHVLVLTSHLCFLFICMFKGLFMGDRILSLFIYYLFCFERFCIWVIYGGKIRELK